MRKVVLAHIAVLVANLFFGIGFPVVKFLTPTVIEPLALNLARVSVTLLLFWLLFLFKPVNAGIQKKHIPRFLLCAFTGIALNQILFIKGVSLTSSIHASLLALGTPLFISVAAVVVLGEKMSIVKIAGLFSGIVGAAILIASKEQTHTGANILLGDVYIIINAISYAIYFVLVRPLMQIYRPVHVIRWTFTFGTLMILPFALNPFLQTNWIQFSSIHFAALAFVVLGITFFAYLFNVYGISILGAASTGSYIYTQPVFAAVVAIFFMNEHLSWIKGLAAGLIFTGVYLVNYKKANLDSK